MLISLYSVVSDYFRVPTLANALTLVGMRTRIENNLGINVA